MQQGIMQQRLLREPAARRYLGGMSHGAFFSLRKQGLIEPIRAGRAVYFDIQDLDRLIERLRDGCAGGADFHSNGH